MTKVSAVFLGSIGALILTVTAVASSRSLGCELRNDTGVPVKIRHLSNPGATERVDVTIVQPGETTILRDWIWSKLEIQCRDEVWKYPDTPQPFKLRYDRDGLMLFGGLLHASGNISVRSPKSNEGDGLAVPQPDGFPLVPTKGSNTASW